MTINVIAVGKVRDKAVNALVNEYAKRIGKYATLNQLIIKESLLTTNPTCGEIERVLNNEAQLILDKIGIREYVIVLDVKGSNIDSETFAQILQTGFERGQSKVVFVIGSSHGLAQSIKERANYIVSFSNLTIPHQLFKVMLFEQVFRAFKILNNESYHK